MVPYWKKALVFFAALAFLLGLAFAFPEEGSGSGSPAYETARVPVKKAKLIKHVEPVYPEEALKQKIQGIVVLEAVTDVNGDVRDVRVVKSASTLLNQAAVDALQQWKYEPFLVDGKPKPVKFTVTMNFRLHEKEKGTAEKAGDIPASLKPIKLLKKVAPVYPEEAKKQKIQGMVILELQVDETGMVKEVRVVESENELLNQAAIDSVRRWQYKPYLGPDGKPKPFSATVTVNFVLSEKKAWPL